MERVIMPLKLAAIAAIMCIACDTAKAEEGSTTMTPQIMHASSSGYVYTVGYDQRNMYVATLTDQPIAVGEHAYVYLEETMLVQDMFVTNVDCEDGICVATMRSNEAEVIFTYEE